MPKYVRVYIEASRKEISVPEPYAANAGYPILDKPAVDRYGKPLRDKPRQPLGTPKPGPKPVPVPTPSQSAPAKADPAQEDPSTEANKEATK